MIREMKLTTIVETYIKKNNDLTKKQLWINNAEQIWLTVPFIILIVTDKWWESVLAENPLHWVQYEHQYYHTPNCGNSVHSRKKMAQTQNLKSELAR